MFYKTSQREPILDTWGRPALHLTCAPPPRLCTLLASHLGGSAHCCTGKISIQVEKRLRVIRTSIIQVGELGCRMEKSRYTITDQGRKCDGLWRDEWSDLMEVIMPTKVAPEVAQYSDHEIWQRFISRVSLAEDTRGVHDTS